jgi:hypothetical protein
MSWALALALLHVCLVSQIPCVTPWNYLENISQKDTPGAWALGSRHRAVLVCFESEGSLVETVDGQAGGVREVL